MRPSDHPSCRLVLAIALLLAGAWMPVHSQTGVPGEDLAGLLALARERNPEFASMRSDAEAAAERVQPAGALPDPVLRTELQNITNAGSGARPSLFPGRIGSTRYLLMQPVPGFGKRDLRRDVALAEAEQARSRAGATWEELAARIKVAYAQYFYVSHNLQLVSEILALMGSLERVAQARYAGGIAPQQDAIRAQVELTGLRAEILSMENDRRQVQARLNTLLARPAGAPLAEPRSLRALPPPARVDASLLEERARARNPLLAAEAARVRAAERNRDLVLRNRYPDFTLGIAPVQMGSRIGEWEVMVEFNIPLQQETRRSQEREAAAMLSSAAARRDAATHQVLSDLAENLSGLEAARDTERLVTSSLLPQAQLTLQSALAAYENGRVDFATLLDAQRQIRRAKLDRLKAQVDAQIRLADIERVLGEDL